MHDGPQMYPVPKKALPWPRAIIHYGNLTVLRTRHNMLFSHYCLCGIPQDVYDQSPGERSSAFEEDLAQEGMEEEGIANHEEATERLADVQEEPIKQRKGFTMHEVDAAISEPVNEAKEVHPAY